MKNMKWLLSALTVLGLTACSRTEEAKRISIDGSSTVFPLSEAIAELASSNPKLKNLRVGVALSGTGGGFKKFCAGEIEIAGASRPISDSEKEICAKNDVTFVELPVAYDGIAVVVNKENPCIESLSVAQLKMMWEPAAERKIKNWNQIHPLCPDMALNLYGPGHDSGTFDYFTEAVVGKPKSSRSDFTASEDDNVLVTGVAGDKGALGYFGYVYFVENSDKLKLVAIDSGNGPVLPSAKSISNGTYSPLSRPLFIYVAAKKLENPNLSDFVRFYVANSAEMAQSVGYISLGETQVQNEKLYDLVQKILIKPSTGALFSSTQSSLPLEERLKKLY